MRNQLLMTAMIALIIFSSCEKEENFHMGEKEAITQNETTTGLGNKTDTTRPIQVNGKTSILKSIWLRNDHEPRAKGKAEIYAYIIGLDIDKNPIYKKVNMTYLNHDKTVYERNDILIRWSDYAYNHVNILIKESDYNGFPITEPAFSPLFRKNKFKNMSVSSALRAVTKVFKELGNPNDDHVETFYDIFQYKDYYLHHGEKDNAYIILDRGF